MPIQPSIFDVPPPPAALSGSSLCAKLARYFEARAGQWIDGRELATVAGAYAWRSRTSDLRKAPWLMVIENRQRKANGFVISEYRFVRE